METNITVVGSIALDTLETSKGNRSDILGGSATYFSIAASKFSSVEVIGIVGDDFPQNGWDVFNKNNINYENIIREKGKTFRWGGRYNTDYSTRETLFTDLGVFEHFMPQIKNTNNKNGILFLANIHPSLQLDVLNKMSDKISLVVSDTMNLWIDLDLNGLNKVIENSNIFLLNDEEAIQLTKITDLERAGKKILNMGPDSVIIKMGAKGSLLITKNAIKQIPCVPNIDVYDPTGAGDSFAGGLIGYLSKYKNNNMMDALLYASSIASFTVSDFGINKILNLNLNDIENRVKILRSLI
tara:strand:+ start:189 stop:1082 length:894 start_codon:yes stop_codon:yes gene_type:complete